MGYWSLLFPLLFLQIGWNECGVPPWVNHGGGLANLRNAKCERKISVDSAPSLTQRWRFLAGFDVSATPSIADDGTLFFPSWNGLLYSITFAGALVWKVNLSEVTGVSGALSRTTPVIASDNMLLVSIYGPALVVALRQDSGSLIWITKLDNHPQALVTMSGTAFKGAYYIGVSSGEEIASECCTFQGSFQKLDLRTGKVLWRTPMLPDNHGMRDQYAGAAVWGSSPSIDEARPLVYIATGNLYTAPEEVQQCEDENANRTIPITPDPCLPDNVYQEAVLALELETGNIRCDVFALTCFQTPRPDSIGPDYDFGQAPMLLSIPIGNNGNCEVRDIAVIGQKSGIVWALDRDNGDLVWDAVTDREEQLSVYPDQEQFFTGDQERFLDDELCNGKRVYMYELPTRFNLEILDRCNKLVSWLSFCDHFINHGFGKSLYATNASWYATDPYMLEVIFHERMQRYRCLVDSPALADAFFIPYYAGLDALRFLYGADYPRRHEQGVDLVEFLEKNFRFSWKQNFGHDHFMVTGRTAWDFASDKGDSRSPWGTGLRLLKQMENVTTLVLERRPWIHNEQPIPYPTSFHPSTKLELENWINKVGSSQRSTFISFIGAPRPHQQESIRGILFNQCINSSTSSCKLVDCSQLRCAHNPIPIAKKLLNSIFCFQPPGDTYTRRSSFDSMICGCIPVFFNVHSAYTQYTWHLPPEPHRYSIFISESQVRGGLSVEDFLKANVSWDRISELQKNIREVIPRLLYFQPGNLSAGIVDDAFDVSIRGDDSEGEAEEIRVMTKDLLSLLRNKLHVSIKILQERKNGYLSPRFWDVIYSSFVHHQLPP